jgi:hypothetical protein
LDCPWRFEIPGTARSGWDDDDPEKKFPNFDLSLEKKDFLLSAGAKGCKGVVTGV